MYFLNISIPTPLRQHFDYLPPPDDADDCHQWPTGIRVLVPFGHRQVVGILLAVGTETTVPAHKLKTAIKRLDGQPLFSPALLKLCYWVSDYYHHPLGEVMLNVLPKSLRQLRKGKSAETIFALTQSNDSTLTHSALNAHEIVSSQTSAQTDFLLTEPLMLNLEQRQAVEAINAAHQFTAFLLEGVTGSGKTEVYFHCITEKLMAGKQILVLVPEIALTPQMVSRFEQRFNTHIVLLHSNLTDLARAKSWLQASCGEAKIIIGTRSAIFTPLKNPGLIILDEEHDLSFKQQSGLRYSARDLALIRARLENIPVILGSATPSLESLHNCQRQRYRHLIIKERAGPAVPPTISLIDLRNLRLTHGLSALLIEKIKMHLEKKQQVMIFLNRRGYAPLLFCHQCSWMAKCNHCDARLTLHLTEKRLFCHHCGASKKIPTQCEHCQHHELIQIGMGTERIENAINELFPDAHTIRIDRDSTRRKGKLKQLLTQAHDETADILIGTQMLAKGHHFPKLTLVAIIDADSGLFSSDFRAEERMAQLLIQVTGRAGRGETNGEVVIQTHQPQHPLLQLLLRHGYHEFAKTLLQERMQAVLPPFNHFALLRSSAKLQTTTIEFLTKVKQLLAAHPLATHIEILGPIPALMERRKDHYHAQLLIQSRKRHLLQKLLQETVIHFQRFATHSSLRWSLDVDPQEMC